MLELLMSEWENLLKEMEYEPVHHALRVGIALLEKYYHCADDTDVYFIAHGKLIDSYYLLCHAAVSFGSCPQTWISWCDMGWQIH